MKKVLMVAASLRTGGAEKVARDLGLLGAQRYEFHYLVFEDRPGEFEPALQAAGCRIVRMSPPSENYVNHIANLIHLMLAGRYDIVHAHTMFHCGWVMLAGKWAGIPVRVAHAHSELREGGLCHRVYEGVMGLLIRRFATDLVACSPASGRRLFGDANFQHIPNGISTGAFAFDPAVRETIRRELGWENCRVLGHVGRLNRVKNQRFLLELMTRVGSGFRLLLIGEGADRMALEQEIADKKLGNRVKLMGNLENPAPYYSAMDAFLLPSLYEGMPLAALEARCSGLPCLVSDRVSLTGPGILHLSLDDPESWTAELMGNLERIPGKVPDVREMAEKIYEIYERSAP